MTQILSALIPVLMIAIWCVSRVIVASMLCKHPELSDERVEAITKMMCKSIKIGL